MLNNICGGFASLFYVPKVLYSFFGFLFVLLNSLGETLRDFRPICYF